MLCLSQSFPHSTPTDQPLVFCFVFFRLRCSESRRSLTEQLRHGRSRPSARRPAADWGSALQEPAQGQNTAANTTHTSKKNPLHWIIGCVKSAPSGCMYTQNQIIVQRVGLIPVFFFFFCSHRGKRSIDTLRWRPLFTASTTSSGRPRGAW